MAEWYVLHTKTAREVEVGRRVRDAGMHALVPRRQMTERRRGVTGQVIRCLFPGYVFVNTALEPNDYYTLTGIRGVIRILGAGRPQPVQPAEMNRVLGLVRDDELIGVSTALLERDGVKIVSGPLRGLEGQIVKLDRRKGRAKVNIPLFGEPKIIELSVNVLQKSE